MKVETKVVYKCDVKGCDNFVKDENIGLELQIIFTTEQNEGRSSHPYLEKRKLDLCKECKEKLLSGNYIFANGAQGNDTFYFKKVK